MIYKSLELARELRDNGERDAGNLRQRMSEIIRKEPLADIDYISIADAETLEELDTVSSTALVSLAVRFGRTRLIDNLILR